MRLLILSLLIGASTLAWADISVELMADKSQVSVDDQIELQVTVQGTRQGTEPELLNVGKFEVQSTGTSSQVQIINTQITQQLTFGYVLSPKEPGKFRIGPARVNVGGKNYESASIEVIVTKGGSRPNQLGQFQGRDEDSGTSQYFYIVADVDNKTPLVNQQINYTFKFYNRAQLANAQLGLPDFKGFLKEGPDKQREGEEIVNGNPWHVTSLRFALFPITPGNITIDPARLVGEGMVRSQRGGSLLDDFFSAARPKRVTVRGEPVSVVVSPLPSNGRPANFTGLVGQFTLGASLSREALPVGDSSTLTVSLDGNGNLRDFALPEFTSNDFKVYDDQPKFDLRSEGKSWKGSKTFKRALVPLKAGELTVPPLAISYYDPSAKAYRTLETSKLVIRASASKGEDSVNHVAAQSETNNRKSIEVVGKDLMPIKRSAATALRSDDISSRSRWILFLSCLASPFLYAFVFFFKLKNERLSSDLGLSRKNKAFRQFSEGIKKLDSGKSFFEEASILLREYLGNKFNLDGRAITSIEAGAKLSPYRLSADIIKRVERFLSDCEASEYGGLGTAQTGRSTHLEILVGLVNDIEKEARR